MNRMRTVMASSLVVSTLAMTLVADIATAQDRGRRGQGARQGGRQARPDNAPKVGLEAPLFKLKSLDGKQETDLKSFRGQRPVILFFGSYT